MSQAEALLASMSDGIPIHTHPVPDTDTYFVIDPITKKIENTNPKKSVIMQYDHNSERFTFELPRYIDGHDMLECTSVTVNVDNIEVIESDGVEEVEPRVNPDAPDMTDLRVHPTDPEKVISSWLITRNSTQLAGILSFNIEYKCVDSNGNVVYEWSTDNYDEIEVRPRKKNGEAAVIEHTDLLEQWRARIFRGADSVMANIATVGEAQVAAVKAESETQQEAVELKGAQTLDTIPEDYTQVDAMADEAVRSKGDAIVCEAAGESIAIKDSSDDYIRGLRLFGKSTQVTTKGYQLFDASVLGTVSKGGATIANNGDGSFTVTGSGTLTENIAMLKDYTHEESLRMLKLGMLHCPLTQTMPYCYVQIRNSSTIYFGLTHSRPSYEITQAILDDEDMYIRIGFYGGGGEEIVSGTIKPMLYQDGDGTWEPFSGGKPSPNPEYPQDIVSIENPMVCIYGKNLAYSTETRTLELDGVILNAEIGKSEITVSGTASKRHSHGILKTCYLSPGTYTVSVLGLNTIDGSHDRIYVRNASTEKVVCNQIQNETPRTFTVVQPGVHRIDIVFENGSTYNNRVVKVQVERGANATDYESFKPTRTVALANTLPGIPVTSGGNYTDSDGQQWICDEIDLERGVYVQRIKKYIVNGTEPWTTSLQQPSTDGHTRFDCGIRGEPAPLVNDALCTHAPWGGNTNPKTGIAAWVNNPGVDMLQIRILTEHSTVEELTEYAAAQYASGTPVTYYYILATPIETPLTAEEITAFKALRTNYPNTTILNDAGAWMSVKYNADTKSYVDKPKALRLTDTSTGVVYELKIVDGSLTVVPV